MHPVIEAFKTARRKRGLSQIALAELAGYEYHLIRRLEQGLNSPRLQTLADIGKVLGLEICVKEVQHAEE